MASVLGRYVAAAMQVEARLRWPALQQMLPMVRLVIADQHGRCCPAPVCSTRAFKQLVMELGFCEGFSFTFGEHLPNFDGSELPMDQVCAGVGYFESLQGKGCAYRGLDAARSVDLTFIFRRAFQY